MTFIIVIIIILLFLFDYYLIIIILNKYLPIHITYGCIYVRTFDRKLFVLLFFFLIPNFLWERQYILQIRYFRRKTIQEFCLKTRSASTN